jgi:NAD(P)-dependent dehydrogenase (short-subunit alcohol dehydrogenase family)
MKLAGMVALVTGAGRGIGRGIAESFGAEGARVVVASRTPATVDVVVANIRSAGGEALGVPCDVSNVGDIRRTIDLCVAQYGVVDVLVNNAQSLGRPSAPQTSEVASLEDYPEDAWDHIFETGAKATFRLMQAVFPYMKERGGKIINFGSGAAQYGRAGMAGYNANKEAIRGLSRTAARDWAKYKINVNVISPLVGTEAGFAHPNYKQVMAEVPLGRLGTTEEAAALAVFLASPAANFMTGQTFMLDGGRYMHSS